MAFTVQPFVGEEKLWELLEQQTESESLDYKRSLDVRQKRELCELAKDVGAMQVRGGYIVIGADNRGRVTGDIADGLLPLFDESRLRGKLRRYLPDNFELLSASHAIEGKNVVLIYVGPNSEGFAIFKSDGNYPNGCAFRKGEVYARHGTASEPWSQSDISRIINSLVTKVKEDWFAERRAEVRAELDKEASLVGQLEASQPVSPERDSDARETGQLGKRATAETLSWQLDAETLRRMVIEQLRDDDPIPLKLFLRGVVVDASRFVEQADSGADTTVLLDRLTCLAALFLELDEGEWFERVIQTLVAIYDLGFDAYGVDKSLPMGREQLWLMVIERAVALGSVAVRGEKWLGTRYLATRVGRGQYFRGQADPHYFSWVRHGLTMAARANMFGKESLISLAHTVAQREECLRPSLTEEDDRLLTSICQFDALAMLATIDEANRLDVYYPSFSRYYEHRTQPVLAELVTNEEMRKAIFPRSDEELAAAIRYIDEMAQQEGFRFAGWASLHDPKLRVFLERHPPGSTALTQG